MSIFPIEFTLLCRFNHSFWMLLFDFISRKNVEKSFSKNWKKISDPMTMIYKPQTFIWHAIIKKKKKNATTRQEQLKRWDETIWKEEYYHYDWVKLMPSISGADFISTWYTLHFTSLFCCCCCCCSLHIILQIISSLSHSHEYNTCWTLFWIFFSFDKFYVALL